MQRTFIFYNDPAHGWLKVSRVVSEAVGLTNTDYTPYSYEHNGNFYLEEDADAPKFLKAFEAKYGAVTTVDHFSENPSRIRSYTPICKEHSLSH